MKGLLTILASWAIAACLTAIAVTLAGESPLLVFSVLARSAAGSLENLSYTFFYATPVLITAVGVSLALEAGLFNIGAEGQLYLGATFAVAWGILLRPWLDSHPTPLVEVFVFGGGMLAAMLGGGLWGLLVAYLKRRRGVHEVISCIMLNFIGMAFANWVVLNPLKNPETQNTETIWISEPVRIPSLWHHVTWGFPVAIGLAFLLRFGLRKTWWGFRVRVSGQNESAARIAGIDLAATTLGGMALAGAIAGLAGFHEVYLHSYRLIDGFSPGYGFMGLAVALLSRGNPWLMLPSAFLFAALHKGALDLDLETDRITRDLSAVIQALVLVAFAAQDQIRALLARWEKAR